MSGGGSKAVGGIISRLFKKPWKYTGPTAHPEYLEALDKAGEYRPFAPTNAPTDVIVPAAETERIYDIKYFNRDDRRVDLVPKSEKVPLSALLAEAAATEVPPAVASYYHYGKDYPLNDEPHEGYQK